MIRTILVATDGSDHAKKALTLASDLAAKYGARLVLAHVFLSIAWAETLRALASRKGLSKRLRDLLDNYEADFQMEAAAAAVGFVTVPPPRELGSISHKISARAECTCVTVK